VIYRELFPRGLTALDSLEASLLGVKPSLSHVLARLEVRRLIWTVTLRPSDEADKLDVFSDSNAPAIEAPRTTVHAKLG
jgi:hypothetical protein